MPKVSVIVPVFNTAEYIEKCAVSLFEQTMDDVEYIFIDDCSTDGSMAILETVVERYPDRKPLVKTAKMARNSGPAAVRRTGISMCTGDYVIHCDSDDSIEPDMLESMYSKATAENLDMVICDLLFLEGDRQYVNSQYYDESHDMIADLLLCKIKGSTCNKMLRRQIYETDGFIHPVCNMCEDSVYSVQYAIHSERIGYIPKAFYHYYRHPQSFLGQRDKQSTLRKHSEYLQNFSLIESILTTNGKISKYAEEIVHQRVFINSFLLPYVSDRKVLGLWKEEMAAVKWKAFMNSTLTIKDKIVLVMAYCGLYPSIVRLLHKR